MSISSRVQGFYQRKTASLLFRRPFTTKSRQHLISFTFDDFPRSALLTGGAILNKYGSSGTYYACLGLMGQEAPTGKMFVARDLATLFDQGHELGCHTFSHCDSWDTSSETFERSIIQNREALQRLIPGAEFQTFSYPISLPRPRTKAKVAKYFAGCRAGGQTLNAGRMDLNHLAAFFLEQCHEDFEAVKNLIDRAHEEDGWLIFATHDIAEDHTRFGCTPKFFEQVVRYSKRSGARILPVSQALEVLGASDCRRTSVTSPRVAEATCVPVGQPALKPLVSILIPAYNAEEWIADTLRSALAQTWPNKEIIVVDDGSTDQTLAVARKFESDLVRVVTQKNQGAAVARNTAFSLSKGDYIQWLDADDLLSPHKISRQMEALDPAAGKRILLSGPFGQFLYRWYRAQFVPTALWMDQSPKDWLLRKMGENLFMQTGTWLVSRELTEAAGLWDVRLCGNDDDGEYFCRVLLASESVQFVPNAKVYYRVFGYDSLSYIGESEKKRDALWLSMQLHIQYLRSLEDSPRTRASCVEYLQRNLFYFYPDCAEVVLQSKQMARELGGELEVPRLAWWYSFVRAFMGWRPTKQLATGVRRVRKALRKRVDQALFWLDDQKHELRMSRLENEATSTKLLVPNR